MICLFVHAEGGRRRQPMGGMVAPVGLVHDRGYVITLSRSTVGDSQEIKAGVGVCCTGAMQQGTAFE
jgi:hypothetical protein